MKEISTVHLFLADSILFYVNEEKAVETLWEKLGKLHETNLETNNFLLKKQLYHLRRKDGSIVVDHLNKFNTLIIKLLFVGVKVDDKNSVNILLYSLLDTWDHMVVTITISSSRNMKFHDVVSTLLGK